MSQTKRPETGFEETPDNQFFPLLQASLTEKNLIKGRVRRMFEELLHRATFVYSRLHTLEHRMGTFLKSHEDVLHHWCIFNGATEEEAKKTVEEAFKPEEDEQDGEGVQEG